MLDEALLELTLLDTKRLLVMMPPRHGKSELCSRYLPAWYIGNFPEKRVILASYEATFAASWGRKARETLREASARGIFEVAVRPDVRARNEWQVADHEGGMVTAGVGGAITGRGGDLVIIDDPVKNAEEASSSVFRDKNWEWYSSTAYSRLEPAGRIVLIMTRWHQDDLGGRILAGMGEDPETWRVISLPAIAEEGDVLGREVGDALWPERFPLETLATIRTQQGSYWWSALYQQSPVSRTGGMFERHWFPLLPAMPRRIDQRVRYWDRAATEGGGDWTVGLLMARIDGEYVVEDVQRIQGSPREVELLTKQTAELDGRAVPIRGEEEGGSSGKAETAHYVRLLAGWDYRGRRATGSKELRAGPVAAQAEAGNIKVLNRPWATTFLDELAEFGPGCKHDDQVDALSGAFAELVPPVRASIKPGIIKPQRM